MRTRLLRGRDGVTVQLVYPSTLDEYRQDSRCPRRLPSGGRERRLAPGLPPAGTRSLRGHDGAPAPSVELFRDLAVTGGVVPVDETRALDLLHDAAAEPDTAADLFPGRAPEAVSGLDAGAPGGSWFDAVRGLPLARRAHRSRRRSARRRRPAERRPRGAVGQADPGVRLRRQGGRGGAGPGSGGARPAVGQVRAPAVRPGSCGAGARSHPRRPRRRQGRHPPVPGDRVPRRATC